MVSLEYLGDMTNILGSVLNGNGNWFFSDDRPTERLKLLSGTNFKD